MRRSIRCSLYLLGCALPLFAADDTPNGPYPGLLTWPGMQARLSELKGRHPDQVFQASLGKTLEGRDIPVFKISDHAATDENEPELLIMTGIHPREQQPQHALMRLVEELLEGYGKDARLTRLVDEREIWVVPIFNVDGKVYDMQHGNGTDQGAEWRKNRRRNADGSFGVDLNRNFGSRWGGNRVFSETWKTTTDRPDAPIYEGPAPMSEPETRALVRSIESRPLTAFIDFHSPLRRVYYPEHLIAPEHARYVKLARAMRGAQKEPYPLREGAPDTEPAPGRRAGDTGLTYTWAYYARGVYSFNVETGLPGHYPPKDAMEREYQDNLRGPLLAFIEGAGELPPPATTGKVRLVSAAMDAKPTPGSTIAWTPKVEGACDYGVLMCPDPRVVVQSEYRRFPVGTGFTLQVMPYGKPGDRVPLTLYAWDRERRRTEIRTELEIAAPSPTRKETTMPNARVLLVDDEPWVLKWLRLPLERVGYRVRTAGSGEEALAQVREEPPDVILLDEIMPRVDGFHVLRELKSDPATAAIPVVILKGQPAEAREYQAIYGPGEFFASDDIALTVLKPYLKDPGELVAAIDSLVATRPGLPGGDARRTRQEI